MADDTGGVAVVLNLPGPSRETLLRIEGHWPGCGDVNFELMVKDGDHPVGWIGNLWNGLVKKTFTDTDNCGIQFPLSLDVKIKAVLIGAFIFIRISCSLMK